MRVYYDRDADVNLIKTKKVVIVGYGSQGHAHVLTTCSDSGVKDVVVALQEGSRSAARRPRPPASKCMTPAEAAKWADVLMMLTPDELQARHLQRGPEAEHARWRSASPSLTASTCTST
ncbi:MAG: hypothetical protein ACMVO3_08735 [Thalassobaculum sp.]